MVYYTSKADFPGTRAAAGNPKNGAEIRPRGGSAESIRVWNRESGMETDRRFAVLIDADNVSDKYIKGILDELSNDGIATYKRIYGDWTNPKLGSWKAALLDNSVMPIQQYAYTTGKNATDSAMIIDAMDILYSGRVEGFCIVSSDSDFTRLAARLREAGMYVVGMGEKKTPKPFIAACNKFTYLELIAQKSKAAAEPAVSGAADPVRKKPESTELERVTEQLKVIVEENSDDDGWAHLGTVGTILIKRSPDFDVRNFGYFKLTPFIQSLGCFEVKSVSIRPGTAPVVYLKQRT